LRNRVRGTSAKIETYSTESNMLKESVWWSTEVKSSTVGCEVVSNPMNEKKNHEDGLGSPTRTYSHEQKHLLICVGYLPESRLTTRELEIPSA